MTRTLWDLGPDELLDAYDRMRRDAPVQWDTASQSWLVAPHELVSDVLRDHRTFGQAFRPEHPATRFAEWNAFKQHNMIDVDPPDHMRLRGLVARSFTPKYSEQLRPWIRDRATGIVTEALERDGSVAVVRELAETLAVGVIARMLGVPDTDQDLLRRWGDEITRMYEPTRDTATEDVALAALGEFTDYIVEHAARRRAEPSDDLLSALVAEGAEGGLTDQEVVSTAILLLNGGHETSVNALGNAVIALLADEVALQALRADEDLLVSAADELLRHDSPLRIFPRRALRDSTLAGVDIPGGDVVTVLLECANRDPEQFDRADQLVLDRRPNRHVAFGTGIHVCLGAPLARIELQEALRSLLQHLPTWTLAAPPVRRPAFQFSGYTSVVLTT